MGWWMEGQNGNKNGLKLYLNIKFNFKTLFLNSILSGTEPRKGCVEGNKRGELAAGSPLRVQETFGCPELMEQRVLCQLEIFREPRRSMGDKGPIAVSS